MGNKASQLDSNQIEIILSPDELRRSKNAFFVFDQAGLGEIEIGQIARMMQGLGHTLSYTEIRSMIEKAKIKRTFTLNQWLQMQARRKIEMQFKEKVVDAYKDFERCGSSKMSLTDVRETVASLEGDLSPARAEEILRESVKDEPVSPRFNEFIKVVVGK
mmetsp:Transcript_17734/g.17708  ORF Transcript_17734/g.17708 Transcript_17734/m.17708 type:complete len:160 (-) Transcript_17734:31-510(-)|eukprot:CAMPEP_0202948470 /NCGR_PEP_ID=MMETSP1395-20130829/13446_1 /ASSEMBLY_ACC=CAM_ASM_000871 /TAXON_ID=5961 /ORGANISM="Blepharisma japonicum, Strain Stock R1072" /LENGTH=159 /DNA_ID=CAMNT_0049650555 /DNA_START=295 /DNA_END=774 /DNA_ORIENTATION=+